MSDLLKSVSHALYDAKGNIVATGAMSGDVRFIEDANRRLFIGHATEQDLIDPTTGACLVGAKGAAPSEFHDWDTNALTWTPNLARARAALTMRVRAERTRRRSLTITYNGTTLQADDASYDAISTKLDALTNRPASAGQPAASTLVWRDATNTNQSFASVTAFKTFLSGLLAAIDDRNAGIDLWAWGKKDAINAAADWTALSAINPTA